LTSPKQQRVLIADADPGLRRSLYAALLKLDVFSDTVADGQAALECVSQRGYAIILLDLALPKVDTLAIVERLSARPDAERPMILLMTTGAVPRASNLDCVQIVLRKPIDVTAIAEVIQSCVRSVGRGRPRAAAKADSEREQGDQPRV